ncbi:hypothetical protein ElyMa_002993300 [Elysia marginata]|uniref:Uncharacterized protein n=1 Tax=Elysia marginata TaxID=1093978 RepID=A0AAV4IG93_9GAST|nr:hypothetical protein ElyMa_002993300 [Elysia marginata]
MGVFLCFFSRLQLQVPPISMSHTLISAAILLASVAASSALFRPPFMPVFGAGPVVPLFGPRPFMPMRPFGLMPPMMSPMARFQGRQRRSRVSQQVQEVGTAAPKPRTRPFVARQSKRRSDRPIDGVTVNLIDNRNPSPSNVYLVDYGRDGLFDSSMDVAVAGPGLNFDVGFGGLPLPGPGLSAMDMGAGFLTDDRFHSGDVSIDGNVYISNSPKPGPGMGGSLGAPLANPGAPAIGPVGAPDVFDYGLSGMPIDTGSIAIGNAPPAATIPLV